MVGGFQRCDLVVDFERYTRLEQNSGREGTEIRKWRSWLSQGNCDRATVLWL